MRIKLLHAVIWSEEIEINKCPHCGEPIGGSYITVDRAFGRVETFDGETIGDLPEYSSGEAETIEVRCYECGETIRQAIEAEAKTPAEIARLMEMSAVLEDARRAERGE